ncbi:MAG: hypothetical protein WBM25_06510 [Azonexus sp.]
MSAASKSTLGRSLSGVWVLGFVSLLPLFMVTSLGASALVALAWRPAGHSPSGTG